MSRLQDLARRVRAPRHGGSEPAMPPNAALPETVTLAVPFPAPVAAPAVREMTDAEIRQMAEDYFRVPPQPAFTPSRPPAETGPMPAAPMPAAAKGRHAGLANARPAPHRPPMNRARLAEVRDSLQNLPDRAPAGADGPRQELEAELRRQAAPRPVANAARQRATRFTADARKRGGLPVFRAAGRSRGWAGLDSLAPAGQPDGQWAPWPDGQWAQAMARIGAQAEAARAEIGHYHAGRQQQEARIRDAADAAPALGYPGEAL